MKADSIRAASGRKGGRRRDGSALFREGRDGQVQEKEMSQTQWWMGRDPREEGEREIIGQKTVCWGGLLIKDCLKS